MTLEPAIAAVLWALAALLALPVIIVVGYMLALAAIVILAVVMAAWEEISSHFRSR